MLRGDRGCAGGDVEQQCGGPVGQHLGAGLRRLGLGNEALDPGQRRLLPHASTRTRMAESVEGLRVVPGMLAGRVPPSPLARVASVGMVAVGVTVAVAGVGVVLFGCHLGVSSARVHDVARCGVSSVRTVPGPLEACGQCCLPAEGHA